MRRHEGGYLHPAGGAQPQRRGGGHRHPHGRARHFAGKHRAAPPAGRSRRRVVPVVLMTYATTEATIREALAAIVADGYVAEQPQVIRIERE